MAAGGSSLFHAVVSGGTRPFLAGSPGPVDRLVHHRGSGFSACYQNACLAAAGFPNVGWWIPATSSPQARGPRGLEACRLRPGQPGRALPEAGAAHREGGKPASLLNRLDYMVKGGRCSTVAAPGGQPFEPEALH